MQQKDLCSFIKKVMWIMKCVKFSYWSFFTWSYAPWLDRSVEIDSEIRYYLRIINIKVQKWNSFEWVCFLLWCVVWYLNIFRFQNKLWQALKSGFFYNRIHEVIVQAKWTITNFTRNWSLKEMMFGAWWDWKRVPYNEFLLKKQTIDLNKYCSQLDQLKAANDEKCLEIVKKKGHNFHHVTVRLHVSLIKKAENVGFDTSVCW